MANFGYFHSKSFQPQVPIVIGFWASRTIMEKVLSKKIRHEKLFCHKILRKKRKKIFAESEIWTTNVLIRIHLLYHLSYPGIYELSELFLNLMTSQVFIIFFKKKIVNHKSWAALFSPPVPIEILIRFSAWDGTL